MAELELLELREDLLIEILVRLPVKSLIRCTCVCKHWLSLIQSPDFVTKHHSTRSKLFGYDSVLSLFKPGCSISIFSYQDLTFQTAFKFRPAVASYDPPRFDIYHRDIITDCSVFGPCNGLFLIKLSKGVFQSCYQVLLLWNPATKELFKLPKIPNNGGFCYFFSFGFDTVTHDYKVVGLYANSDAGTIDNSVVWLYSLAINSWSRIFDAYRHVTHFCSYTRVNLYFDIGSSSNGRMHNWILSDDLYCQRRGCLLSFDMVDQVFVETPLPSDAPNVHGFLYQGSNHMYPTVYCILRNFELHVWDLQQGYGPAGVWNKLLNVKFPQVRGTPYMVLWKNKEILLSNLGTMSSYNLATQQMKSLRIPADDSIIAYTESLVSIARSVRQPPTMDHSSDESVPLQLGDEGPVDDQQDLSETTPMIHQMLPKEDDDSDDSSTDSAFSTPDITAFTDTDTVYIDYETHAEFYPLRKNEVERLSKLPYCLHEINKPMISNPCTF